jgi:uncharacterized membrane protein
MARWSSAPRTAIQSWFSSPENAQPGPRCGYQPRGFDVPEAARWFPVVSGVQAVADLVEQLGPLPGFAHVYWTDYVKGWAQVVPPEGWTDADTARLYQFLHG